MLALYATADGVVVVHSSPSTAAAVPMVHRGLNRLSTACICLFFFAILLLLFVEWVLGRNSAFSFSLLFLLFSLVLSVALSLFGVWWARRRMLFSKSWNVNFSPVFRGKQLSLEVVGASPGSLFTIVREIFFPFLLHAEPICRRWICVIFKIKTVTQK